MALDMEQLIYDAKILAERLKDKESDADNLISQTQLLKKRVEAMKQYQDDLTELNEVARHRPRAKLIHEIAKENRLIRELQQENFDLRTSLEEYQSALEMIMSKYREQITRLVASNKFNGNDVHYDQSQEINKLIDKVCEMAAVMQQAVTIDDTVNSVDVSSLVEKLRQENRGLRDLLAISATDLRRIIAAHDDKSVQTLNDSTSDSSDFDFTPNSSMVALGDDDDSAESLKLASMLGTTLAGFGKQNGVLDSITSAVSAISNMNDRQNASGGRDVDSTTPDTSSPDPARDETHPERSADDVDDARSDVSDSTLEGDLNGDDL